jgi:hypothetical protein
VIAHVQDGWTMAKDVQVISPLDIPLHLSQSAQKQAKRQGLQQAVIDNGNVFEVGGHYRRNQYVRLIHTASHPSWVS